MRIKRFHRDLELHGHHKDCPQTTDPDGLGCALGCTCAELDLDDDVAAGEAEYDRRREEPRERTVVDD